MLTTNSMALNNRKDVFMNEKLYKQIKLSGAFDLVAGIISIAVGVSLGVLLIVSGARLLSSKSKTLF